MVMLLMSHESGASPPASTTLAQLQDPQAGDSVRVEDSRSAANVFSCSRARPPLGGSPGAWRTRSGAVLSRSLAVASPHAAAALGLTLAAVARCCCFLQITGEVGPRGCLRTARDVLPREARSRFLAPPSQASILPACLR